MNDPPTPRDTMPPASAWRFTDQGLWFEATGDIEGWITAAHIVEQDGQPVIAEVRVFPGRYRGNAPGIPPVGEWDSGHFPLPPRGLTRKMFAKARPWRLIPVSETLLPYLEAKRTRPRVGVHERPPLTYKRRPGRTGHSLRFYAEAARRYVELYQHADPHPTETLSKELYTSYANTKKILGKARKLGLLTRPPRGKAGGRLTDKALETLEQTEEDSDGEH